MNRCKHFTQTLTERFNHKELSLKHTSLVFRCYQLVVPKQECFRVNQVRYINKYRPPPGVIPVDPKAIPYVAQDLRPKGRGNFLLWIPVITFGLGTWQIKRLKWKTNLISTIEERMAMDPIPLSLPIEPEEVAQLEFRKVTVKGTFDHKREIYYGPKPCFVNGKPDPHVISKTGERSYGFNLVTPFVLSDSGERILVNRGWIQSKMVPPDKREWSKTEGEQTITGVIRNSEPPFLIGPSKTPMYKIWHIRDVEDMAKKKKCLPIYIDATAEHSIPNLLWGGQTVTVLRNEHLSYVITWYALSIATAALWYAKYVKK